MSGKATATIGSSIEQMDLTTVVRALQAVSGEIDLEKLTETLTASALEHAGAERGLLFLRRGHEHRVATLGDRVEVTFSQAFAAPPEFPESFLRYAVRKLENVILDDASAANPFSGDPYMLLRRDRSISLQPFSIEVTTGLYVAAGMAGVDLKFDSVAGIKK
jgi:hypothetical protein